MCPRALALQSLKPRHAQGKQGQVYFLPKFLKISSVKLINVQSHQQCQKDLCVFLNGFLISIVPLHILMAVHL